jgi:cytochrome c553
MCVRCTACMSRLTITLTAAAASALATAAVVALPAVGDDSNNGPSNVAALAACLRSHGLDGAPDDAAALKPWIAQRQTQDPQGVKAAMNACQEYQTGGPDKPKVEERRELSDSNVAKLVACMRDNGLDAPSDPVALKRWLQQEEQSHPDDVARVMPKCKMQLDPSPPPKDAKPGVCGDEAKPSDTPKPDATPEDSKSTSTQST